MIIDYVGVKDINGPLIILDNVENASFEEIVDIRLDDGTMRQGRIVQMDGKRIIVQVFEGTRGISLTNTKTRLMGHPMEMPLSPEILGRVFDGAGRPIDGLGNIFPVKRANVNGTPINPVARLYPKNFINTGISTIDVLMTLIRGQKLPIFSGSGMKHNELAVQIARQAKITGAENGNFAIVFAAMGVKNDVADYFRRSFEESGILQRVVMFLNLANDPIIERILTPRCALTVAEYLAFELGMHILVIMTDMTSYAEALREFSSSKGEIPGRKGFPGYLYSDLASLYERAGMIRGKSGSVTQIPILTMPNDDVTHPVPDLTGYITEGQIVLDRSLDAAGTYPPVAVLPSLSRLMKDGIGAGFTREDHSALSNQLFAAYAKVMDARSLASVIGEEELSPEDKQYIQFGKEFEAKFVNQGPHDNRSIEQSLDLGWELLTTLPRASLDRVDDETLDKYYEPAKARVQKAKDKKQSDMSDAENQQENEGGSND
jgi:V/A-type H+-transporting ATPase subunit B